jgi:hypothetical protein
MSGFRGGLREMKKSVARRLRGFSPGREKEAPSGEATP